MRSPPSSLPTQVIDGGYQSDDGTISMHPQMLTNRVLIHDLVHRVIPVPTGDTAAIGSGEGIADRTGSHGALFTASLAYLTVRLLPEGADSLRGR